ncbi:MAG: hypothetical protein IPI67_41830 [Myxococcales bacterium]|nr:hypothetical protein [Myxococcales bacterium]
MNALDFTPQLVLTYASGIESGPNARFGYNILTVRGDGTIDLEHRWYTRRRTYRGRVDASVIARLLESLRGAGFPKMPPSMIPPGSALRTIHVRNGELEAYALPVDWHTPMGWPGFKEVFRLLDSLVRQASCQEVTVTDDFEPGLVTDATKLGEETA